jgi:hypothetical protein
MLSAGEQIAIASVCYSAMTKALIERLLAWDFGPRGTAMNRGETFHRKGSAMRHAAEAIDIAGKLGIALRGDKPEAR